MRTMKELAQEALNVQDACNISGVVHSFSRVITELRELMMKEDPENFSTGKLNHHPICILFVDKMESLAFGGKNSFSYAYDWAKEMVL